MAWESVAPWELVLFVVLYVAGAVWVLWVTWRVARPGGNRLVAMATVAALLLAPTLVSGYGVGVAPWWVGLMACLARDCRDPGSDLDVLDLLLLSGIAPLLAWWVVLLVLGVTVQAVWAMRRRRE